MGLLLEKTAYCGDQLKVNLTNLAAHDLVRVCLHLA